MEPSAHTLSTPMRKKHKGPRFSSTGQTLAACPESSGSRGPSPLPAIWCNSPGPSCMWGALYSEPVVLPAPSLLLRTHSL